MTQHTRRPAFRFQKNDSLQYHFFAEDKIFSIRFVFRGAICVHAAWIFDGSLREISKSEEVWTQADTDYLDISSEIMRVSDENGELIINVKAENGEDGFEARVRPDHTLNWKDTFSPENDAVLHLPDLQGTLTYRGKAYETTGYCKHVEWSQGPRYTGYRFLHGVLDHGDGVVWSADAVFGYQKYDYFKMITPDGSIVEGDGEMTAHKQNTVFSEIEGRKVSVTFEELGRWELPLLGQGIDMVIMQRYGRIKLQDGEVIKSGVAMTEYGFGKYSDVSLASA